MLCRTRLALLVTATNRVVLSHVLSKRSLSDKPATTTASVISAVSSSASSLFSRSAIVDPKVNVVTDGMASMLHIEFSENSAFYSTLGSAIGMSEQVQTHITTEGGPFGATMRMISGGDFFLQKFYTSGQSGDMLISPKTIGDIATVVMDGTAEYYIARHAYLASTPKLTLAPRYSRLGVGGEASFFHIKVRGSGTLAIHAYGGLFKLQLAHGEVYLANPKHLVAWQSTVQALPLASNEQEKGNILTRTWKSIKSLTRGWVTGGREFYRLIGPGEVYFSSRLEPRFPSLKSLGGLASSPTIIPPEHKPAQLKAPKTMESPEYDDERAESREEETLVKDPISTKQK